MKIVIIGNGIAGNSAASIIRKHNKKTKITLVTEEDCPAYSACALGNYMAGDVSEQNLYIRSLNDYIDNKIDIKFNLKIEGGDSKSKVLYSNKRKIHYDKLIIAAGSSQLIPPIPGHELKGIFCLKTIKDANSILENKPAKVVIIGSGPIGLESAVALNKRNCDVSVIELENRILPNLFDKEPAGIAKSILEAHGINVFTEEKALEFQGKDKISTIVTNKRKISCDTLIIAAGMKPNTELAESCNVKLTNKTFIAVDRKMATSNCDVYACGDCVETNNLFTGLPSPSMLWHNAKQQGDIAGLNALGLQKQYRGHFTISGVDLCGKQAVSIEKTSEYFNNKNMEIIKNKIKNGYYRIIIKDDIVQGLQYIGPHEDLGILFTLMQDKKGIKANIDSLLANYLNPKNRFAYRVYKYIK